MKGPARALPAAALAGAGLLAWLPVTGLWLTSDSFLLPLLLDGAGRVAWGQVAADWTGPWLGVPGAGTWRPLVTLHYAVDLFLFGADPLALHLSNLALHLAAGLAVFALVRGLLPRAGLWAAWVGAFVYLVHPARAEAVAWVPGRVDVTAALPAALSALALLRGVRAGGPRGAAAWALLSLGAALAAYAAKEMALALPLTLLVVATAAAREGGRRRAAMLVGLHLLLWGGVLLWRAALLRGVAGPAGPGELGRAFLDTLPGKALAALAPPLEGERPVWLGHAAWWLLPLAAGLVRGRAALGALPVLLWWALALLPASPVAVVLSGTPDWSGTRVLLLPALPQAVLYAILLGAPARPEGPAGALRWLAGGALCAVALVGTQDRLADWREAGATARAAVADVGRRARPPHQGPLAMAALPVRPGRASPFRYDVAFLAFRRPFSPVDQEVLVLDNTFYGPAPEAGPVHQASTFCRAVLAWLPGQGAFTDLGGADRSELPLALEELETPAGTAREGPSRLRFRSPPGSWLWLPLPDLARSSLGVEGLEARVEGAGEGAEIRLCWWPPGGRPEPLAGLDAGAAQPGGMGTASCHPCPGEPGRWLCPCGNLAGFYALHLYGRPVPVALALRGRGILSGLRWLGRLPRLPWSAPARWRIDPKRPEFPVPPGQDGPWRLVVLTPMRVLAREYPGGWDRVPLGREGAADLAFLARMSPEGQVYFYAERLAAAGEPATALLRTHVQAARLGGGGGRQDR